MIGRDSKSGQISNQMISKRDTTFSQWTDLKSQGHSIGVVSTTDSAKSSAKISKKWEKLENIVHREIEMNMLIKQIQKQKNQQ